MKLLSKCDLNHYLVVAQVLRLHKQNMTNQMRQKQMRHDPILLIEYQSKAWTRIYLESMSKCIQTFE